LRLSISICLFFFKYLADLDFTQLGTATKTEEVMFVECLGGETMGTDHEVTSIHSFFSGLLNYPFGKRSFHLAKEDVIAKNAAYIAGLDLGGTQDYHSGRAQQYPR
jgi:hypothetical protein